ncbi:hypothetical protein GOODEAATRI_002419 [Goodea atripinnis]|uniref:Nucleoside phosphorylase domain-containing protein n=1 Tax=Goodea atripinnis TaxID=208336 RepID=A0ABV0PKC6_9TELE
MRGTMLTIEGPRFSSRAESLMFRQWGADVINMTTVPEVVLAKEAGLCYASIAMATDYDCWKEHEEAPDSQQLHFRVPAADLFPLLLQNTRHILPLPPPHHHSIRPNLMLPLFTPLPTPTPSLACQPPVEALPEEVESQ